MGGNRKFRISFAGFSLSFVQEIIQLVRTLNLPKTNNYYPLILTRTCACQEVRSSTNFIEVTIRHGCSLVNLLFIFRISFLKKTSGQLLLQLYFMALSTQFFDLLQKLNISSSNDSSLSLDTFSLLAISFSTRFNSFLYYTSKCKETHFFQRHHLKNVKT